jgi:hypothetical protein
MKNTINLLTLIFFASFILFTACKKRDDSVTPNAEEDQRARLSKAWVPETPVQFNGANDTRFENFKVTFNTAGTYTSENGAPVFRTSGNWAFKGTDLNTIVLDGRPEFVISTLNDTKLVGTVELSGGVNARTTAIDGTYSFNLVVE